MMLYIFRKWSDESSENYSKKVIVEFSLLSFGYLLWHVSFFFSVQYRTFFRELGKDVISIRVKLCRGFLCYVSASFFCLYRVLVAKRGLRFYEEYQVVSSEFHHHQIVQCNSFTIACSISFSFFVYYSFTRGFSIENKAIFYHNFNNVRETNVQISNIKWFKK